MKAPDIDIDLANRDHVLPHLDATSARIDRGEGYDRHNTGIYLQPIPRDPLTGVATIDHRLAAELGYFKLDLLNNSVYQDIDSEEHLLRLMQQEPDWDMLLDPEVVAQLYHVHDYGDLLQRHRPRSVLQLAMFLAIIRPAKRHLQGQSWPEIEKQVWTRVSGDDNYQFKKAHSVAFAHAIVVQMNRIRELQMQVEDSRAT